MSTPEERLRGLDPAAGATYDRADAAAMVDRILVRSRPRRRRRTLVAVPIGVLAAVASTVLGLALTASGSPALAPLVLSLHGGPVPPTTTAGHVAATADGAPLLAFAAQTLDNSASGSVSLGTVGKGIRLVAGPRLASNGAGRAEVYDLIGPTDPVHATRDLAASLGMSGAAVRAEGPDLWRTTSGTATLWTVERPAASAPAPALSWSYDASGCAATTGCRIEGTNSSETYGVADPPTLATWASARLSAIPAAAFKSASVQAVGWARTPLSVQPGHGPSTVYEFSLDGPLLRGTGLLGTLRARGEYPLASVREGAALLGGAGHPGRGARVVVLRSATLRYVAVELVGGSVALVPVYVYAGSDGHEYVVLAVSPAYVRR